MNLDFRKLTSENKAKAIQNIFDHDPGGIDYLAHIISNSKFDVFTWFILSVSNEGADYWYDLQEKQAKENKKAIGNDYIGVTSSTLVDDHGRPYEQTENGRMYLSKTTAYEYSIKN
jgi:hypothetical protein